MGRKRHEIITGTINWHASISNMPQALIASVKIIAAKQNTQIGVLLRDWIAEGVKKEENKLKKEN
jgi:hypothetical protein